MISNPPERGTGALRSGLRSASAYSAASTRVLCGSTIRDSARRRSIFRGRAVGDDGGLSSCCSAHFLFERKKTRRGGACS